MRRTGAPCAEAHLDDLESLITEDAFLDGRVRVRQPAHGYRAGADSILLAAAVSAPPGAHLMEAGCGAGAALLAAAVLCPKVRFTGVEREADMAELALRNVAAAGLQDRVRVHTGDALKPGPSFDGVFFNPPFDLEGESPAPHPSRRYAYQSDSPIEVWIKAFSNRLSGGAALTLIHRAHRLGDILTALSGRLGGVQVFPIRPRAQAPAKRILVRAVKGARAPLQLLKGLDLHEGGAEKFTPEAEAVFRGEKRIEWAPRDAQGAA